jgi:hypothetical protein
MYAGKDTRLHLGSLTPGKEVYWKVDVLQSPSERCGEEKYLSLPYQELNLGRPAGALCYTDSRAVIRTIILYY